MLHFRAGKVSTPMQGDLLFWHETDPLDRLIQWRTRKLHTPSYNHVEVELDDGRSVGAKADGVQYHRLPLSIYTFGKDSIPSSGYFVVRYATRLTTEQYNSGAAFLEKQIGKQYDVVDFLLNAWAIFFPHGPFPKTPQQWTCSELAADFLVQAGNLYDLPTAEDRLQIITPNDLARVLEGGRYALSR